MNLAQLPNHDGARLEGPNGLGNRDLDHGHDWKSHRYPVFSDNFWQAIKVEYPETTDRVHSSATVESLEFEQRQLMSLLLAITRMFFVGSQWNNFELIWTAYFRFNCEDMSTSTSPWSLSTRTAPLKISSFLVSSCSHSG